MNDMLALATPGIGAAPRLPAETLAILPCRPLREEALLTPKPGLVRSTRYGRASRLMDCQCYWRSAMRCTPHSRVLPMRSNDAARRRAARTSRRDRRDGEAAMLAASSGVNTHRGAIWSLGLLIAACASPDCAAADAHGICTLADGSHACPIAASAQSSHGAAMLVRHGARGARAKLMMDFRVYTKSACLLCARRACASATNDWRVLHALLSLNRAGRRYLLLYRGGREALEFAQRGAQEVLALGTATAQGQRALLELDRGLIWRNASPGGSADLLAATLFVDRIAFAAENRSWKRLISTALRARTNRRAPRTSAWSPRAILKYCSNRQRTCARGSSCAPAPMVLARTGRR